MSAADNGGPAFPRDHAADGHNGMTLRDYFAAKAMQGFAADPQLGETSAAEIAELAFIWANAMLKERAK